MAATERPKTVSIHGAPYVPVDERVRLAHAGVGYSVTGHRVYQVGERWFYEVEIEIGVGERRYTGTSEIRFGGRGIDATSPMENAETSAYGRALGFAGIGVLDGIASAEEVQQATGQQSTPAASNGAVTAASVREERIAQLLPVLDSKFGRQQGTRWLGEQIKACGRERIEQLSEPEFTSLLAAAKGA